MLRLLICVALLTASAAATAQSETKNVVLEKDGKLYIQSTTINQVETNSTVVGEKIEKLQAERAKIEENLARMDDSIKELQSLYFELQKKEKRLKKDEKSN